MKKAKKQTRQHTASATTATLVTTSHDRCETTETNLRARVSDLEDRIEELHDKLALQQEQAHQRELEWVDRYTAVLNPVAARVMGMNRAMQPGAPLRTPKTRAMEVAEDDGGGAEAASSAVSSRPDLDPARSYRREPAKRAPLMTPDRAGFRPSGGGGSSSGGGVRIPVKVEPGPEPRPDDKMVTVAEPSADPTASAADAALGATIDARRTSRES